MAHVFLTKYMKNSDFFAFDASKNTFSFTKGATKMKRWYLLSGRRYTQYLNATPVYSNICPLFFFFLHKSSHDTSLIFRATNKSRVLKATYYSVIKGKSRSINSWFSPSLSSPASKNKTWVICGNHRKRVVIIITRDSYNNRITQIFGLLLINA